MSTAPPRFRLPPLPVLLGAIVLIVVAVVAVRRLTSHHGPIMDVPLEKVERRDIAQTVEATGTLEPVEIVEIKSKASGQILKMPVEIGSVVKTGDLLAQIDNVNVKNQYDESLAALKAAQATVDITGAQAKRADDLFSREVITADQHEAATLAYANAMSSLARARSDMVIAGQALADATVRAPSDGTIIEQDVTRGQVIASATSSASGGTTLLKMADLNRVQMQALVGETDIGNVQAGQEASVTVDAFPNRTFRGQVIKIEPQATVQQSVTMFPVLVSIANENGLLLPGMNGEVTIAIAQRLGVLAVSLDAVRSARELPTVATALGLEPDTVAAQFQRQVAARMAARGRGGDSARVAGWRGGGGGSGAGGGATAMAAAPGGADPADSASGRRAGQGGRGGFGNRGGSGGFGGSGGRGGAGGGGWRGAGRAAGDSTRARGGGGGMGSGSGGGGLGRGARQAQVVFVQTAQGLEPRVVRLGISDYDYAEVLDGVTEGEQVALVSVAEVQAKRQEDQSRLRQRMGTGMPGVPAGGGARAGGGGGGGGARPSGGTGR